MPAPAAAGARATQHEPFRVDVHPERDVVRVVPVGELDLATSPRLQHELLELRNSGFDHVVLDLRQLTFIDSSGIRVVVAEHRFAERADREFSLISGPPAIQRVLELCGMLGHLHIHDA
jgi:anti-sigma B factor antagonist